MNYYKAISHVETYSKFRPSPPASLITAIANYLREELPEPWQKAVDIGCGSGQSTAALAPIFREVFGLDSSDDIIKEANLKNDKENVKYRVSSAEKLKFDNESVDLVTTVQAIHWFDTDKFYAEVGRILKKNGVLAVYGYSLPEPLDASKRASTIIRKYYEEVLKDYVLAGSRQAYLENYSNPKYLNVPFVKGGTMKREENFNTDVEVTISDVTGYMSSMSGFQNFVGNCGNDAGDHLLQQFQSELMSAMNKKADDIISIRYRYFALLGRKS